ncbi:TOTE conflict system archaeo-eukaryotic primase domain-containing protein [Oceanobacillus locisalsi]|uniref:DEAD/DEAH box helicase family protein n=1 Tax=Oceanobacillus locisalsi TaxID=546107 RepID=A0ABW3NEA8_9BACI
MNKNLWQQLSDMKVKYERLEKENQRLKDLLKKHQIPFEQNENEHPYKDQEIKRRIEIFNSIFIGRQDVYAHRQEEPDGGAKYSPVYEKKEVSFVYGHAESKGVKNTYKRLTNQVIYSHLSGEEVVGIYPLLRNNTCWFLALDFDKNNWEKESQAVMSICHFYHIPAARERSRSGKGCHIWIFFSEQISAVKARNLGYFLLRETLKRNHWQQLNSFDRMFPTQDSHKGKGLGNLIALPLQKQAREEGNSVFIDQNLNVISDQWHFLSGLHKLGESAIDDILEDSDTSWVKEKPAKIEVDPERIQVSLKNGIYIRKDNKPERLMNEIIGLAAFNNPEYYKKRAKRLSTHDTPKIIDCSWQDGENIIIPRGCLHSLKDLLEKKSIRLSISDQCDQGKPVSCDFQGQMTFQQEEATQELMGSNNGIIAATTGFGKTVLAASLMAQRGVNTLIIVNRKQLVEQWKEKLAVFLNINKKQIGQIGGGKNKPSHYIDIAMIQSLNKNEKAKENLNKYGQVIVDECHHISAVTFEDVLRQVTAKYVYGLTATPARKDGLHPIMSMQCGSIIYKVSAKKQAKVRPFRHILIPRYTKFKSAIKEADKNTVNLGTELVKDAKRNEMIFDDVLKELDKRSTPIILTERIEHVEMLEKMFSGFVKNIVILNGNLSDKEKRKQLERLNELVNEETLIIATGKYIGEGFDNDRLDCLFLVYPFSYKGILQQYVGRLHRLHQDKTEVKVYDYIDYHEPLLKNMYQNRAKGYRDLGYRVMKDGENDTEQMELF